MKPIMPTQQDTSQRSTGLALNTEQRSTLARHLQRPITYKADALASKRTRLAKNAFNTRQKIVHHSNGKEPQAHRRFRAKKSDRKKKLMKRNQLSGDWINKYR
jgi:hypothetical protein